MNAMQRFNIMIKEQTSFQGKGGGCVDQILLNDMAMKRNPSVNVGLELDDLAQLSDHRSISIDFPTNVNTWNINRGKLRHLRSHSRRHKTVDCLQWCDDCLYIHHHSCCLRDAEQLIKNCQQTFRQFMDRKGTVDFLSNSVEFALKASALSIAGVNQGHRQATPAETKTTVQLHNRMSNQELLKKVSCSLNDRTEFVTLNTLRKETTDRFFPPPVHQTEYPNVKDSGNYFIIDRQKLHGMVSRMLPRKSQDRNGISGELLALSPNPVTGMFHNLFATVLDYGVAPEAWKVATIVPVYKRKGDKDDPNSYRPISLISVVRKVFESVHYTYLERSFGISDIQGGFRSNRGIITNIAIANSFLGENPKISLFSWISSLLSTR